MNRIFLIAVGIAGVLPLTAQAQDSYVGFNLGSAKQKFSVSGESASESKTGAKVYAGTNLDQNFGVELGYVDFGRINKSFNDGVNAGSISVKSNAFYVAGTATAPINDQFAVFAKLGITANRSKLNATVNGQSGSTSRNNTDAILGIGGSYAFSKELSAVVKYENFGKVAKQGDDSVKADLLSVGLRYKF